MKKPNNTENILGYIELENTLKPIRPTNDIFINYMYLNEENWEDLRKIGNIFLRKYKLYCVGTKIQLIKGNITVETQYEFLLDPSKKRKPDLKIIGEKQLTFMDIQNSATSHIPIPRRGVEYFGLEIGHANGKTVLHIWLLAEDIKNLTYGQPFKEYTIKAFDDNELFPYNAGSILFVNLKEIAKDTSKASQLAGVLLGTNKNPTDKDVRSILNNFKTNFSKFSADKGVKERMTVADKYIEMGMEQGIAQGREQKATTTVLKLFKKGFGISEISEIVEMPTNWVENISKQYSDFNSGSSKSPSNLA